MIVVVVLVGTYCSAEAHVSTCLLFLIFALSKIEVYQIFGATNCAGSKVGVFLGVVRGVDMFKIEIYQQWANHEHQDCSMNLLPLKVRSGSICDASFGCYSNSCEDCSNLLLCA